MLCSVQRRNKLANAFIMGYLSLISVELFRLQTWSRPRLLRNLVRHEAKTLSELSTRCILSMSPQSVTLPLRLSVAQTGRMESRACG
jgi:hypothetical protein